MHAQRTDPRAGFSAACLILCSALFVSTANADDVVLEATVDFPSISDGDVPYYIETARNALAINAANTDFRDRFARAEHVFEGSDATFDLTLHTIGENDGEGLYRIWIDGELVGEAINAPTDQHFMAQSFVFEDVEVATGSVVAVESMATSNGLIPENGEYAFARGRWTSLQLDDVSDSSEILPPEITPPVEPTPAPSVDLSIELASRYTGFVNSSLAILVPVRNASDREVATGVAIDIDVDAGVALNSGSCAAVESDTTTQRFTCPLPELASGDQSTTLITVSSDQIGEFALTAFVRADQDEADASDNTETSTLQFSTVPEPEPQQEPQPEPETTVEETIVESEPNDTTDANESTSDAESELDIVDSTDTPADVPATTDGGGGHALWLTALLALLLLSADGLKTRRRLPVRIRVERRCNQASTRSPRHRP